MDVQQFLLQNAQNLMSMGEYDEGIKLLRELGDYPLALKLLGCAYYKVMALKKIMIRLSSTPCCDKIIEEGDFGVSNNVRFIWSIMAMRMFMRSVDEVINNKSNTIILKKNV